MRFVTFKKFLPTDPESGTGYREGDTLLMTEHQVRQLNLDGLAQIGVVDLELVPSEKLWRPGDRPASLGWYYPAGLGDSAAHTVFIRALSNLLPDTNLIVVSNAYGAAVWARNTWIDMACARQGPPTKAMVMSIDKWIFGESILYDLKNRDQGNMYLELSEALKIPMGDHPLVPEIFLSAVEIEKFNHRMRLKKFNFQLEKDSYVLFFPSGTKENRSLSVDKKAELSFALMQWKKKSDRLIMMGDRHGNFEVKDEHGSMVLEKFPRLSVRELILLCSKARRIVSVDSAALHIGAAFKVPTVALMGAFTPAMRTETYPNVRALFHRVDDLACPCCWHEDGFNAPCPGAYLRACSCLEFLKPSMVTEALDSFDN